MGKRAFSVKGKEEKKPAFKRSAATRRSVRGSLRSGYAFSHSQGFGDLILKGKLFKNVEQLRKEARVNSAPNGLSPVVEQPQMLTPVPNNIEMSPSSAGMPIMTLPYEPVRQPHSLVVNDDEWSILDGDLRNVRGTVIRGDGNLAVPSPTERSGFFEESSSSSTSLRNSGNNRRRPWRTETEV
ncbi:unnamed protein product [Strongylus vulgaris]|uniref:Uncharacterized protein n=1 Tax=Strongylus vulgaris TaxID=40348 RepID=A0A3P7J9V0_STRVU|nr:unnamed protein product [Strongylus vulgaris]